MNKKLLALTNNNQLTIQAFSLFNEGRYPITRF